MRLFSRLVMILVFLTLLYLASLQKAYAYLDPGTTSFILQLIIAALVGTLCTVRLFWNKIKTFFKNLFSRGQNQEE